MGMVAVKRKWYHDRGLWNIIHMGVAGFFLQTANQSAGSVQQTVVNSVFAIYQNETNSPPLNADAGYTGAAITTAVFTIVTFFASPIVGFFGDKCSLVIGGVIMVIYLLSFLYLTTIFLYICAIVAGFAGSIMSISQGSYLAGNSSQATASRNSGAFWGLQQSSFLAGGLFIYFELSTTGATTHISMTTIRTMYIAFSACAAVGLIILCFLQKPAIEKPSDPELPQTTLFMAFFGIVKLSLTPSMLLLFPAFLFCGGLIFGIFGGKLTRFGRSPIIFAIMLWSLITFFIIFLNIASDAPNAGSNGTYDTGYIKPNQYLAIACAFMLGFSDSVWSTQLYALLSTYYSHQSKEAFSVYKLIQFGATSISYYYSGAGNLNLHWQLLIIGTMCFLGAVCFFNAEWRLQKFAVDSQEKIRKNDMEVFVVE